MCCPNCWLDPDGPIDAKLAQLKAEISFIETTIKRLSSRRRDLLQRTNTLSLISKLPTEILIDIFELTCESTLKTDKPIVPLLFGAICRDWRQLTWSTPLLWSTVSVKVSKRPMQVKLLREWLIRAQSSPLSIYSTLDLECYTRHEPFRDIFELLLTRVEYWKTLDCAFPPLSKYCDMLQHREFPLLTSLSLRSTVKRSIPTISLVTPRLLCIELSGYYLSNCNLEVFPLKQLHSIKMQGSVIKLTEALALLHCARALKECYFSKIREDSTPTPTLHTTLELLYIRGAPFFLDSLTLPNLRVLAIDRARDRYRYSLYRSISSLVSRSSCQLARLNLVQDFPLEDDAIIALLEALPSLIHLYLASKPDPEVPHGLSDNIVSRLRPSQDGSCLLPRLTSFKYRGPVLCKNRLLIDMLAERWHSVPQPEFRQMSRLTRAEIVKVGKSDEDLLQDVRADMDMLVSEGMQLTYKFNVATR